MLETLVPYVRQRHTLQRHLRWEIQTRLNCTGGLTPQSVAAGERAQRRMAQDETFHDYNTRVTAGPEAVQEEVSSLAYVNSLFGSPLHCEGLG